MGFAGRENAATHTRWSILSGIDGRRFFTEVLTWPGNRGYIVKVRAALNAKIRPSSLLFKEQPNDPWTDIDFLLVEAMQLLEDETCQQCGNPIWICRNESAGNVGFKIKTATCFADAELEKWREKEEKKKSKKKTYGSYPYTVPYTYDGSELPSRAQFYKSMAEKDAVE